MKRFKGRIVGENRNVEFNFLEERKAYIDIYNYIVALSESNDFWDMLECNDTEIEEYKSLISKVHIELDRLLYELARTINEPRDIDLLHRVKIHNWYSSRGLRDLIIKRLRFISNNTYFKLYNHRTEKIERLSVEDTVYV